MIFREAKLGDENEIFQLIFELAKFEKLVDLVEATPESVRESLFEREEAKALVCEIDNQIVAIAIYFYNYSTFLAKRGLYLEDLIVKEEFRGRGIGKTMLQKLAKIAVGQGLKRFEWVVLDWNKNAIDFYKSLGSELLDDWIINRVSGENLIKLAK